MIFSFDCCVLSGRGLWDGPIPHPGEACRVCVCTECDQTQRQPSVLKMSRWKEGRLTEKERGKERKKERKEERKTERRNERRKEGKKEGRKERKKEGRKEGRKERKQERRKEGKKEIKSSLNNKTKKKPLLFKKVNLYLPVSKQWTETDRKQFYRFFITRNVCYTEPIFALL